MKPAYIPLLLLLLVPDLCAAQGLMQRKRSDLIPLEGQVKRIGWYVGPGVTWTHTRFKNTEEEVFRNADTTYAATYDPAGRIGLYLEAGLTWYTRDPVVVDHFDVGFTYKNLRGSEVFESTLLRADSTASMTGEGTFAERLLTFNANANKFIRTGRYQFVQLSLGANVDYRLGSSYEHTGDPFLNGHDFPPDLIGQLHFKVGYGVKVTGKMFIIPAIETPVFSVVPEDQGLGQLQWFSSTYRPIILSVRFLFLRARDGFDCPPPIKHNEFEKGRGTKKEYKPDSYHP